MKEVAFLHVTNAAVQNYTPKWPDNELVTPHHDRCLNVGTYDVIILVMRSLIVVKNTRDFHSSSLLTSHPLSQITSITYGVKFNISVKSPKTKESQAKGSFVFLHCFLKPIKNYLLENGHKCLLHSCTQSLSLLARGKFGSGDSWFDWLNPKSSFLSFP